MRTEVTAKLHVRDLHGNAVGFNALARLHTDTASIRDASVRIDCSDVQWMDAHLAAPFMTIIRHMETADNQVSLSNLSQDVATILRKNRFLERRSLDSFHTTIPVTEFELESGKEFSAYAKKHLDRREMPRMSEGLRQKFFEAIDELFENSALHSKSNMGVCAGGQFFPRKAKLCFAVSDGGRSIAGSRRAARLPPLPPHEAIAWAMEGSNTTRQGDIPGGLGLKLLRRFVRQNGGSLVVASGGGIWSQIGGQLRKRRLEYGYPGTAVLLEIVTSDRNRYDLDDAPRAQDLW